MADSLESQLEILEAAVPLSRNEQSILKERALPYLKASWLKDIAVAVLIFMPATLLSIPLFRYSRLLPGCDRVEISCLIFLTTFAALAFGASKLKLPRISESLLIFAFASSALFAPFGQYSYLSSLAWFLAVLLVLTKQSKALLHGSLLLFWSWVFVAAAAQILANKADLPFTWTLRMAFIALALAAGTVFKGSRDQRGTVLYEYMLRPVHKNVSCLIMLVCLVGLPVGLELEPWYMTTILALPLLIAATVSYIDARKRRDAVVAALSMISVPMLLVLELELHQMHILAPSLGIVVGLGFLIFAAGKRSARSPECQQ